MAHVTQLYRIDGDPQFLQLLVLNIAEKQWEIDDGGLPGYHLEVSRLLYPTANEVIKISQVYSTPTSSLDYYYSGWEFSVGPLDFKEMRAALAGARPLDFDFSLFGGLTVDQILTRMVAGLTSPDPGLLASLFIDAPSIGPTSASINSDSGWALIDIQLLSADTTDTVPAHIQLFYKGPAMAIDGGQAVLDPPISGLGVASSGATPGPFQEGAQDPQTGCLQTSRSSAFGSPG